MIALRMADYLVIPARPSTLFPRSNQDNFGSTPAINPKSPSR